MFLKLRIIPRRNCIITRHIFETQVLLFAVFWRGRKRESRFEFQGVRINNMGSYKLFSIYFNYPQPVSAFSKLSGIDCTKPLFEIREHAF